jgi:hypothetical protein
MWMSARPRPPFDMHAHSAESDADLSAEQQIEVWPAGLFDLSYLVPDCPGGARFASSFWTGRLSLIDYH